ncbi:MAG TPA: 1,4-dihydroxy-2-naphthoate polyprenyltransferase [Thermoanaerobaculia bacterium]|nr:1,4-dihydroxy-2-naphthoate polyprenyltransferase [Thermoanaerobaculia bacterium]
MTLRPWLLAARPKTLAAAVVPVLIGTSLVREPIDWVAAACALFGAVFIQIGTNLVNDALDFEKGADTAGRVGPLRVTQAGILSSRTVLRAAYVCFLLAALCGIPLIMGAGWPLLVIGVASIAAAYAYTGGPYPLAYHGLGELFVLLFFGLVAVGGSYFVQTRSIELPVVLAGLAAGSLSTVLLAINNLRDREGDRLSNKRTLAVRFGERFAEGEILLFALTPFIALFAISALREKPSLMTPLLAAPMAILVIRCSTAHREADLNRCLGFAGLLAWAFGILFVVGARV